VTRLIARLRITAAYSRNSRGLAGSGAVTAAKQEKPNAGATIALPCSPPGTAPALIGTRDYGNASREFTMTGHNSCGKYPDKPAASILFLESLSAII
jgi:hypothetical protein